MSNSFEQGICKVILGKKLIYENYSQVANAYERSGFRVVNLYIDMKFQKTYSVIIENCRHIFAGELIGCVGDQQASLTHGSIADNDALDCLHP